MQANIRLVSGRLINIDTTIARTVADARRQIADEVGVPPYCFRLVTPTSAEPSDEDPIGVLCDGPITVVIVAHRVAAWHERRFARACRVGAKFIWGLQGRAALDAAGAHLTTFPDTVGQLVALQYLYVNNNQLTTLPDSVGNLVALRVLNVSNNQLTTLPDTVGNLVALENLNLNGNQLTTLPDTVGNLVALQELDLRDNQLATLPPLHCRYHITIF